MNKGVGRWRELFSDFALHPQSAELELLALSPEYMKQN